MEVLLEEFKQRMHIFHNAEDESLMNILRKSYMAIQATCGEFNINETEIGQELVLERSRYVYNEQLQFFHKNFSTLLHDFGIANLIFKGDAYGTDELQE